MTIADQLDRILDASVARTCAETHDPSQPLSLAYAHSLWALEADVRALAASLTEGASR